MADGISIDTGTPFSIDLTETTNADGTTSISAAPKYTFSFEDVYSFQQNVFSTSDGDWSNPNVWFLNVNALAYFEQVVNGVATGNPVAVFRTLGNAFTKLGPTNQPIPLPSFTDTLNDVFPDLDLDSPIDLEISLQVVYNVFIEDNIVLDQSDVEVNSMTVDGSLSIAADQTTVTTDVYNNASVSIVSGSVLSVGGSVFNQAASSFLDIEGSLNLKGTLQNSGKVFTAGNIVLQATIENFSSGVIGNQLRGSFTLGGPVINYGLIEAQTGGRLTLVGTINSTGTVEASGNGSGLTMSGTLANSGTLEATGGGVVAVNGTVTGGVADAVNGGTVYLNGDAALLDGVELAGDGTGTFEGGSGELQDVTVDAGQTFTGGSTALGGTVTNMGTLAGDLVVDGPVRLTGSGQVSLGNLSDSVAYAYAGGILRDQGNGPDYLTNVDNTIAGSYDGGTIGVDLLNQTGGSLLSDNSATLTVNSTLTNQGLVAAGGSGRIYLAGTTDNTGAVEASGNGGYVVVSGTLTNSGTLEATGGGVVAISGTVSGGVAMAVNGGTINLDGNAALLDGVELAGDGTGIFEGGFGELQDVTVDAGQTFTGGEAALGGTVTNNGTLAGDLVVDGPVMLTGGGQVSLGSLSNSVAYAYARGVLRNQGDGPDYLTNVDNTIAGSYDGGTIGVDLLNQTGGSLLSDNSATLTVNSTLTNQGLVAAGGSGRIYLAGTTDNTGAVEASDNGSYVIVSGTLANSGTLEATGSGVVEITGTVVSTTVIEATTGSEIQVQARGLITGSGTLSGSVSNGGLIEASAGTLIFAGVASGAMRVDAYSTLDLTGGQTSGSVVFDPDSTLIIGATAGSSQLLLDDFYRGDAIDLDNFHYNDGLTTGLYASQTGQLVVTNDFQSVILSFGAGNTTVDDPFHFTPDGNGGTLITNDAQPACYCRGTHILTIDGERAIEELRIGEVVITGSGEQRPVRWIGRRSYAGRFLRGNPGVQPVRIRAGALGGGLPRRDLLVSAEHAMLLRGALVPARCLLNGTTILREQGLERVDYFHVELDSHDVVLAEGAPSETFLDDGSRGMFENAAEAGCLEGGSFCAPRIRDGIRLELIRRSLEMPEVSEAA